jgi:TPR repeat protein
VKATPPPLWEGRLDVSGVEPSDAHARRWLEKAAEHGDPESEYELGMFLYVRAEQGEEELAVQSIQSAADQGYGPAQYFIASDAGTTFDVTDEQCQSLFDQAFSWYEEHAEGGDTELRLDYALMHLGNWWSSRYRIGV